MFRFAHPYYFLLLIPLAFAAWRVYRRRVKQGVIFSSLGRVPLRGATWHAVARLAAPALFLAGVAACVAALCRPQTVFSKTRRSADAIAIEMVVDVSGSMAALDFSARDNYRSRLDVVKETFAQFVKQRPDDLIGLISFGGFAATRVPLTVDHDALLQALQGVEIPRNVFDPAGNVMNSEELLTAIGDALATACARLQGSEVKSRIVVLLTDGDSNTGIIQPPDAAKAAKALGIKVYTIGVGSTGRAPFMARDMFGRNVIGYADVTIDEESLRQIAASTGGRYFNVKDPHGLRSALEDIGRLERTRINREILEQYNELFPFVLIPGAILLILAAWMHVALARTMI